MPATPQQINYRYHKFILGLCNSIPNVFVHPRKDMEIVNDTYISVIECNNKRIYMTVRWEMSYVREDLIHNFNEDITKLNKKNDIAIKKVFFDKKISVPKQNNYTIDGINNYLQELNMVGLFDDDIGKSMNNFIFILKDFFRLNFQENHLKSMKKMIKKCCENISKKGANIDFETLLDAECNELKYFLSQVKIIGDRIMINKKDELNTKKVEIEKFENGLKDAFLELSKTLRKHTIRKAENYNEIEYLLNNLSTQDLHEFNSNIFWNIFITLFYPGKTRSIDTMHIDLQNQVYNLFINISDHVDDYNQKVDEEDQYLYLQFNREKLYLIKSDSEVFLQYLHEYRDVFKNLDTKSMDKIQQLFVDYKVVINTSYSCQKHLLKVNPRDFVININGIRTVIFFVAF